MPVTPEIILGPPGTGKTTALLQIVDEELAAKTEPQRIGFFSFTKKAANEATDRACTKFGLQRSDLRYFRTLHSMCFQALGLSEGDVLQGKRLVEFGSWLGVKLTGHTIRMDEGTTFGNEAGDRALFMENLARVRMVTLRQQYDENSDGLRWSFVEHLSRSLIKYKRQHDLLDYTDMLQRFVDQQWSPQLDVLIGDEGQDMSMLQWQVFWKLARTARRVVIAGDDDQAIYKWAGAAVDYFVELALKGNVRVLGQSWRVPEAVQHAAAKVIRRIKHRRTKLWAPRDAPGVVSRVRSINEIDLWGPRILVLVRNAFVAERVMDRLRREGILYDWRGHSSVRPSVLEAVRAWEQLRSGGTIMADEARRVYEFMSSGVGVKRGYKQLVGFGASDQVGMRDLLERGGLMRTEIWHEALDRIPTLERLYMVRARQNGEKMMEKARVLVSTIHGAKGGEAEHVVLLRDMALRTHQEMKNTPDDEARVWYVGATRAKQQLSIVSPASNLYYDI